MFILTGLWHYWHWIGSNVGAMPAEAILTVICAWLFRDHIGRSVAAWWAKHHAPHAIAQHREAMRQHEAAREGVNDQSLRAGPL